MNLLESVSQLGRLAARSFVNSAGWFTGMDLTDTEKLAQAFGLTELNALGETAGSVVNERTALTISAFAQGVRAISQTVGIMPMGVYQVTNDGNKRDLNHPTDLLLRAGMDADMTRMKFVETLVAHAVHTGNGYAAIRRAGGREGEEHQAENLTLLNPYWVQPTEDTQGNPIYVVSYPGQTPEPYYPDEIFHLPGPGFDGRRGYSPVEMHKRSLGLAVSTERYGAKFFSRGTSISGVLTHPGKLDDDARKNLKESFRRLHQGIDNSHGMFLAEEGMGFTPVTIAPEQAQWLGSRRFSIEEIARILDLPLSKLRDSSAASYQTLEQENLFFYQLTLLPWLVRLEEEIWRKLLTPLDRRSRVVAHNPSVLLKGDILTRYRAYALGINWGILTSNEARREEMREDVEGGDVLMRPMNMSPVNSQPGSAPAGADPVTPAALDLVDPAVASTVGDIASTALNGAQVASLKDIVADVILGIIPKSAAIGMVQAAFPFLDPGLIDQIFADVVEGAGAPAGDPASDPAAARKAKRSHWWQRMIGGKR